MEVKCNLKRFKPWGQAVKTFEKIEMANKLDALEAYLEQLYGDSIDGSELNDILSGYIDIGLMSYLGLEDEVIESINIQDLNTKLRKMMSEELGGTQTYEFKIKKVKEDELELTSGESTFTVYIYPEDDLQDIEYAIEDFVDGELAADEDDSENITGTEVIGFKYDMETGEGEFEANIFFEEEE